MRKNDCKSNKRNDIIDLENNEFKDVTEGIFVSQEMLFMQEMEIFIKNVKSFLEVNEIKLSYLIKRTGISKDKIYNIFGNSSRSGELKHDEMVSVAAAFGRKIIDFTENYKNKNYSLNSNLEVSLYTGSPTEKEKETMELVINLAKRLDSISSLCD